MDEIRAVVSNKLEGAPVEGEAAVAYAIGCRIKNGNTESHTGGLADFRGRMEDFYAVNFQPDKITSGLGDNTSDNALVVVFGITKRKSIDFPTRFGIRFNRIVVGRISRLWRHLEALEDR